MLVLSQKVEDAALECLDFLNIQYFKMPPNNQISDSTKFHPDLAVINLCGNVICAKYLESIIKADLYIENPHSPYPNDTSLNLLHNSEIASGNYRSLSKQLIEVCHNNRLKFINIKQGYANCSSILTDDFLITADRGIYSKLNSEVSRSLLISPGYIELEGFDYGFIGGASFVLNDDVFFFGKLNSHPDGERIATFIKDSGYNVIELGIGKLKDNGSAVEIGGVV